MSAREGAIREERDEDRGVITELIADAFGRMTEARIVERLRTEHPEAFGPALVAEVDGAVVGYVCCSAMRIDESPERRMLGLGPIAVLPVRQGMGIGSALMRRVQEVVRDPIVLLGDPGWYARFGFRPAAAVGIRSQWEHVGEAWMVWMPPGVDPTPYRGTARYLPPFEEAEEP